jgi:UDP-glucose:(heptosyl)LPS alpha-1,3-glucosyltransferase
MKIAVVTSKYGLLGGAENFVFQLTERLAEREGLEIHVLANQWYRGNDSITFHKIPNVFFPRFMKPISFAYFTGKKIVAENFDLVHSHGWIFEMDFFTIHGGLHEPWIKEVRRKSMSLFDRAMAWVEAKGVNSTRLKLILPVSTLLKEELLRFYDIPESKIHVIHPGISTARFSVLDPERSRHEVRRRHGLSMGDLVVLFVGMNFEVKRLDLVLKAVADLSVRRNDNPNLKLLVVGKGKKERYIKLARDLGIVNQVVFAGVTQKVEEYYMASDIFAMPSRNDSFGMVVLEAMMAGLPAIITETVGARDLIEPGKQGFILSDAPSVSDVSEKLLFLLKKENRLRMGESAREVARRQTWESRVDQVAELYDEFEKRGLTRGNRLRNAALSVKPGTGSL